VERGRGAHRPARRAHRAGLQRLGIPKPHHIEALTRAGRDYSVENLESLALDPVPKSVKAAGAVAIAAWRDQRKHRRIAEAEASAAAGRRSRHALPIRARRQE
jgi:hypothetical protein